LYNFRMIPYLYDMFKPFLVSHLVLTNEAYVMKEFENDFFNINYDYYGLNIAKLGQALFLCFCMGCVIIAANIVILLLYFVTPKDSNFGKKIGSLLSQFRYNVYIRFYMLSYFDLTFFSVMKYVEGD
jgi:ABC-type phosphate/phosphonate transport system permease subunit